MPAMNAFAAVGDAMFQRYLVGYVRADRRMFNDRTTRGSNVPSDAPDALPDDYTVPYRSKRAPATLFGNATTSFVLALWEDDPLHRPLETIGLVLLARVHVIEAADEEEVGDLLDHLERIGDSPCPERIPNTIDLVPEFTCKHLPPRDF